MQQLLPRDNLETHAENPHRYQAISTATKGSLSKAGPLWLTVMCRASAVGSKPASVVGAAGEEEARAGLTGEVVGGLKGGLAR